MSTELVIVGLTLVIVSVILLLSWALYNYSRDAGHKYPRLWILGAAIIATPILTIGLLFAWLVWAGAM